MGNSLIYGRFEGALSCHKVRCWFLNQSLMFRVHTRAHTILHVWRASCSLNMNISRTVAQFCRYSILRLSICCLSIKYIHYRNRKKDFFLLSANHGNSESRTVFFLAYESPPQPWLSDHRGTLRPWLTYILLIKKNLTRDLSATLVQWSQGNKTVENYF